MITGGQITFSRKLVPAQYESKEASMTLSFDSEADAQFATIKARDMVFEALQINNYSAERSLTSETVEQYAAFPRAEVVKAVAEVEQSLPPTATLPIRDAGLPQGGQDSLVSTHTVSVKVPEWTEANVRTLLTNKVQKLLPEHKERASVLVMECVRAFCPTDPPRATLIPEDKRAAFITVLEGLK